MIRVLGMEFDFSIKGFAQALVKTGRDLGLMFSNKRLWVGMIVSVVLHGLIFLLYNVDFKGKAVSNADQPLETEFDETMPPQVAQILREQQLSPSSSQAEEGAPIDLSKGKVQFQSKIDIDEFSLDKSQANLTGDVIRISSNRMSTDQILESAPIELKRGVGGVGRQSEFDKIAAGAGSPIELDSKSTQIGSEAIKPKFATDGGNTKDAAAAAGSSKKSGFSLSGDLSRGDIVSSQMPSYPGWARQKGLSNVTVSIRFSVDANGVVNPAMVVQKSTGYPNWDSSVKQALSRWRFKPAQGMAKRAGIITFVFILN